MAEKELTTQLNNEKQKSEGLIEIYASDIWRGFLKLWWICILITIICSLAMIAFSFISFKPVYKVSATFTVQTQDISASGTGITSYSYYYNRSTAEQLSNTFPYILESNLLQSAVCEDLGIESLPASITATSVEGTNMFTMQAVGKDPQSTYNVLISAMENYPSVAEYVIGSSKLVMISEPVIPDTPSNSRGTVRNAVLGFLIGIILSCGIIAFYAIARDTIRTKKDIQEKINQNCIGILPKVTFKKYNKEVDRSILIDNPLTGDSFMETVRQLRNSIVSELDEMSKTILFTSASPEEGKTTVSTNLAIALAKMEKRVILIDADIRNPSVEKSIIKYEKYNKSGLDSYSQIKNVPDLGINIMTFTVTEDNMWKVINTEYLEKIIEDLKQKYDYVIIDAPPCALVSDPITIASVVDTTILVIKQDTVRTTRIKYAIDSLQSVNANILGCVLNSAASGIMGYGYYYGGYGYAYNRYGYKKYGYGYGYKYGYGKNRF